MTAFTHTRPQHPRRGRQFRRSCSHLSSISMLWNSSVQDPSTHFDWRSTNPCLFFFNRVFICWSGLLTVFNEVWLSGWLMPFRSFGFSKASFSSRRRSSCWIISFNSSLSLIHDFILFICFPCCSAEVHALLTVHNGLTSLLDLQF